ncbi:DEAD/DEAH box helicase [Candidatus Kaiserbacteria bacterium]|nr:DEAD/DEAH box helicase [Candidatus Kaiserbacteria bacterium]
MQTHRNRDTRHTPRSAHGSTHGRRPHRNTRRNAPHRHGGQRGKRVLPTFDPSQFINRNPVDQVVETYTPKHRFGDFGLDKRLVHTLSTIGLSTPSPIQDQIIPLILDGKDVVGLAETGTGKTAAFLLPLIQKTLKQYGRQTLVLTPTRELAIQIEQELKKLTKGFKMYSTVCVGGTNIRPQIHGLRRKNHFIIGTPGRITDLIDRKDFKTGAVTTVVLDEADRMLDMGFIHPIKAILATIPKERETLFFSATMDKKTEQLVGDFLREPVTVSVKKKEVTNSIKQDVVRYGHHNKFETLTSLLSNESLSRVIIFGSMKHSVEKLSKQLNTHGITSESIHGNKSHPQRQRALARFQSGQARVLVATDVAARGIHVDNVSHVINYDLPNTFEDYVHRIGRTGRGNKKGEALTFVLTN